MPQSSLFRQVVRDFERSYLLRELERNGWNRSKTARELGISYRAIFYKIEKFGLAPPSSQESEAVPA